MQLQKVISRKNCVKKLVFFAGILKVNDKGSISQRHGSADPDPPKMSWIRNTASKSNKQKNFFLNQFFVGVLKINGDKSRIQIQQSEAWIRGSGSGSTPKCHGSETLVVRACCLYVWPAPPLDPGRRPQRREERPAAAPPLCREDDRARHSSALPILSPKHVHNLVKIYRKGRISHGFRSVTVVVVAICNRMAK